MELWPHTLPGFVYDGHARRELDGVERSDLADMPEAGRRRFTGTAADFMADLVCSREQLATFREFWGETLARGVRRFRLDDPVFCEVVEAVFLNAPTYAPIGRKTRVSVRLRFMQP